MDDQIEVKISEYQVVTDAECAGLFTMGLGPCIGVALSYKGHGMMLHTVNAVEESAWLVDPFFQKIEKTIPRAARKNVRPVVAGGCITEDGEEVDFEMNAGTLLARENIQKRLVAVGFGSPAVFWCPPGRFQSLHLSIAKNMVDLETMSLCDDDARDETQHISTSSPS